MNLSINKGALYIFYILWNGRRSRRQNSRGNDSMMTFWSFWNLTLGLLKIQNRLYLSVLVTGLRCLIHSIQQHKFLYCLMRGPFLKNFSCHYGVWQKNFSKYYYACSQSWILPLVDDCVHLCYITHYTWRVIFQIVKLLPWLEKMQDK